MVSNATSLPLNDILGYSVQCSGSPTHRRALSRARRLWSVSFYITDDDVEHAHRIYASLTSVSFVETLELKFGGIMNISSVDVIVGERKPTMAPSIKPSTAALGLSQTQPSGLSSLLTGILATMSTVFLGAILYTKVCYLCLCLKS